MPEFGQDHLSVQPEHLDVDWSAEIGPVRALPAMVEPAVFPPVTDNVDEPLVLVDHPRISCVEAYREAGWQHARDGIWLRARTLEKLYAVVEGLGSQWGLHIFDAWRPLELQAELHAAAYADEALPPGFVSEPTADPTAPPPHLTGGTVDLTLSFRGEPLSLGTPFDDFTPAASVDHFESREHPARDLRRLLYWSMRSAGFIVLDCEWWHFEYGTRRWAAITGCDPIYGPALPPVFA